MSAFLSLEGWQVLDGLLSPVVHSLNTWGQSNVAFSSPVNDNVFPHSQAVENWLDFSDEPLFIGGFDVGKTCVENRVIPVEQHVYVLPTTPEEGYLSGYQIQQMAPMLQSTDGFFSVGSQHIDVQGYAVSSSTEQKCNFANAQSLSPSHAMLEAENESLASSDLQITGNSDGVDVMDMLSQLCDTIDGDMIIDQADMAAFDSFLLPMSPEDVDSLLSDSPTSVTHSPVSSSLFNVISSSPSSPMSESDSSLTDLPCVVPQVVKKQRKKEQNKTAALRYREKKRTEHGSVMTEYEVLESRNTVLKTKVSDMIKEIDYLKGLIAEIYA
jgi:hypothetical protein